VDGAGQYFLGELVCLGLLLVIMLGECFVEMLEKCVSHHGWCGFDED
jgi:hypothetical protein